MSNTPNNTPPYNRSESNRQGDRRHNHPRHNRHFNKRHEPNKAEGQGQGQGQGLGQVQEQRQDPPTPEVTKKVNEQAVQPNTPPEPQSIPNKPANKTEGGFTTPRESREFREPRDNRNNPNRNTERDNRERDSKDRDNRNRDSRTENFRTESPKAELTKPDPKPERVERSSDKDKVIVGITMGDPHGIGPELVLKLLGDSRILQLCTPVLYASGRVLGYYRNLFEVERIPLFTIQNPNQIAHRKFNFFDCAPDYDRVEIGIPHKRAGAVAYACLDLATQHLRSGSLHALVTLPLDKSTVQEAIADKLVPNNAPATFKGHTEFLAAAMGAQDNLMLMVHDNLRIAVVTGHIPLKEVASAINYQRVIAKIKQLNDSLRIDFNKQRPKIAVLGLNPHAGDNGLLGNEDLNIITKAIQAAKNEDILAWGPYPADGFFANGTWAKFDGILAMYHDQGLIPFKTLCEGAGVNFTAGMRAVRTSPDHGTAYDIAGKNKADVTSTRNALYAAIDIYRTKAENYNLMANALRDVNFAKELISGEDSVIFDE